MAHDRKCDEQRLQIEGFAGRIVLGEIHEDMIATLAERRFLITDQRDHGGAGFLRLGEECHTFLRRARERGNDDD